MNLTQIVTKQLVHGIIHGAVIGAILFAIFGALNAVLVIWTMPIEIVMFIVGFSVGILDAYTDESK